MLKEVSVVSQEIKAKEKEVAETCEQIRSKTEVPLPTPLPPLADILPKAGVELTPEQEKAVEAELSSNPKSEEGKDLAEQRDKSATWSLAGPSGPRTWRGDRKERGNLLLFLSRVGLRIARNTLNMCSRWVGFIGGLQGLATGLLHSTVPVRTTRFQFQKRDRPPPIHRRLRSTMLSEVTATRGACKWCEKCRTRAAVFFT